MRTNADGNMVFCSSFGRLWLLFTAFMFLLCAIFFVAAYGVGANTTLFVILGFTFLFSGVLIIALARIIVYIFEKDGIRFPRAWILSGMVMQEFIPYVRIIRFHETREFVGFVYGASTDKIWVEYINDSGKKDGIALSPKKKQSFIFELTKRTGLPISEKPI